MKHKLFCQKSLLRSHTDLDRYGCVREAHDEGGEDEDDGEHVELEPPPLEGVGPVGDAPEEVSVHIVTNLHLYLQNRLI